jgi:two-component system response regulator YesN
MMIVRYLHKYINSNLSEDLSLIRLASLLSFNPSYLSRMHREVTGVKLSDYITNARLEHAKGLLRHTTKNISQIASEVGYENSNCFARAFRRNEGISPSEYRTYKKIGKEEDP